MEVLNNLGPIGKFMHKSNAATIRYLGYYFDEQLTSETELDSNTFLMVSTDDGIPSETVTCLMINLTISFETLHRILCGTNIQSVVFFKDMFVENVKNTAVCPNIKTAVCYNPSSLQMINRFFPELQRLYMYRHNESRCARGTMYEFKELRELHIFTTTSTGLPVSAPKLQQLSVYVAMGGGLSRNEATFAIDLKNYPELYTLRVDERIIVLNLNKENKSNMKILQFFPSGRRTMTTRKETTQPPTVLGPLSSQMENSTIDLTGLTIDDLILPATNPYVFDLKVVKHVLGVYVNDEEFFRNTMTIESKKLQVYDNKYPLKMCSQRFSNSFYKYFPYPDEINTDLLEQFNIQRQRENLIMVFNFDFMHNINTSLNWLKWYNMCIETFHRIPIIVQYGQLMLYSGRMNNSNEEKTWPSVPNKIKNECIIFIPEEELIYINCSPLLLQTLVDKIEKYREQKFIINKLWLVTNGFEIATKKIEELLPNLIIVHNEVKMYMAF